MTKNITEETFKKTQKYVTILEINIDSTSVDKVLRFVRDSLRKKKKYLIVTPNPEQVILAQKDIEFKRVLNAADYSICDAIGLAQAAKYLSLEAPKNVYLRLPVVFIQGMIVGISTFIQTSQKLRWTPEMKRSSEQTVFLNKRKPRTLLTKSQVFLNPWKFINRNWLESELEVIKGKDLFIELVQLANKKRWRVFLLGGEIAGTAEKTTTKLSASYKGVKFQFADGHMMDDNANPKSSLDKKIERRVVEKINIFKPHLLFVGFGAPKQEKWVYRWLPKLDIRGAMAVGGTFDYFAGNKKLPPKWMDKLGLEWVWRIITGDQKIKRILTAFPIFPLKVFLYKLRS